MTGLQGFAGFPLAVAVVLAQMLATPSDGHAQSLDPSTQVAPVMQGDDATLYRPKDRDERGLWMEMDEAERSLRTSATVIRDPALNAYVRGVLCRLTGPARCGNIRLYITRTPQFNASMAPNGMLTVWTGLLLRMRNEAQLATILGHEYTHFDQHHSLQLWRDARDKTNAAGWLTFVPLANIVSALNVLTIGSFSREMERDADAGGLALMAKAGYDTRQAPAVWSQLRDEMDATAAERHTKSRKNSDHSIFASHPPTAERLATLTAAAAANPGVAGATGEDRYRAAIAPSVAMLLDDQLHLNDFGGTEFLLAALAGTGWTAPLLQARGELYRRRAEPGDLDKAVGFYRQATALPDAPAESWRGLGLALLRLGHGEEGRAALHEYLKRAPNAGDSAMMAQMAGDTQ